MNVESPCVSICEYNDKTLMCEGCFRTLEEIAKWESYSDEEKQAVIEKCAGRKQLSSRA